LQTLFRILDRDDGGDIDVQELERALVGKVE
jgi:Ca2+-binding EF-hand superfamily protein